MQDSRTVPPGWPLPPELDCWWVIGAVHPLYAHGYYVFVAYVGDLFYATVAGVVVVAVALLSAARLWVSALGVVLATAALAAFVVSRTIGLPMFPVLPWQDRSDWPR